MKGHQMLAKLRKDHENEEGFTLIELLVVVIIIGILAAIAIPVFLNQREKAWDSAAKSDVKNMSTAQETYYTDVTPAAYSTNVAGLAGVGFTESSNVTQGTCVYDSGRKYVTVAKHAQSDNYFYFDSGTGQLVSSTTLPTGGCASAPTMG